MMVPDTSSNSILNLNTGDISRLTGLDRQVVAEYARHYVHCDTPPLGRGKRHSYRIAHAVLFLIVDFMRSGTSGLKKHTVQQFSTWLRESMEHHPVLFDPVVWVDLDRPEIKLVLLQKAFFERKWLPTRGGHYLDGTHYSCHFRVIGGNRLSPKVLSRIGYIQPEGQDTHQEITAGHDHYLTHFELPLTHLFERVLSNLDT